jgi:hypothetical protein
MAIRDTSVKLFDYSMVSAPVLNGVAGSMKALLDACLVDGFGAFTVASLTVSAGVATLVASGGHGLTNPGAAAVPPFDVGVVVAVGGVSAPQAGLNREWRATVVDADTLTWACDGNVPAIPDGVAAGTITCKRAPAGYRLAYGATNKSVYVSTNPSNTGMLLRLDDTGTKPTDGARVATARGYEYMSDVDVGEGPMPLAATDALGISILKADSLTANARRWHLVADSDTVYLFTNLYGTANGMHVYYAPFFWGDLAEPFRPGDAYHWTISGRLAAGAGTTDDTQWCNMYASTLLGYMARGASQTGGPAAARNFVFPFASSLPYIGGGNMAYPYPVDNGLWVVPVFRGESSTGYPRGTLPGIWSHLHPAASLPHLTVVRDLVGLSDRALLALTCVGSGSGWHIPTACPLMDVVGPWR